MSEAVRKGNLVIYRSHSSRVHKNPLCVSQRNRLTLSSLKERQTHVAAVITVRVQTPRDAVHIGPERPVNPIKPNGYYMYHHV